jgi:hypothetical protein
MPVTPQIIDFKALTTEQIKNLLDIYAAGKEDADKWADLYDASNFTILKEMLAGTGEFAAFHELVRRRESYLDTAKFLSSIFELAFKNGVYTLPSLTATINVQITNPASGSTLTIISGDFLGNISVDYEVYAFENKVINIGSTETVLCVVGKKTNFQIPYSSIDKLSTIEVLTDFKYPALQLETLTAPSPIGSLSLNTDVYALTQDISNKSVLRRVSDYLVKIYIGQGVLGWWGSGVIGNLVYEVLSFGDDLGNRLTEDIILNIDGHANIIYVDHTIVTNPIYGINKEYLRRLAIEYPTDTRMVRERDYESILLNMFTGQVLDIYAHYAEKPDNTLILEYIKGPQYVDVTTLANILIEINNRRAQGIKIDHDDANNIYETSDGKDFSITVVVGSYSEIVTEITAYLNTLLNVFMKTDDENADIILNASDNGVESTNVSADTSDDSFNIVTDSFELSVSELKKGDLITVDGWTSPATSNNGLFMVADDPTSAKIKVKNTDGTAFNITTKAAGDTIIIRKVQKHIYTIYDIINLLSNEFERPFNIHGYVVDGLLGTTSGSLTMTRAEGIANIRGITYNIETGDTRLGNTYTDDVDTYVFLHKDGTFRYVEVATGGDAPSTPINTIKIDMVRTTSGSVSAVTDLRERESIILAPNQFLKTITITYLGS